MDTVRKTSKITVTLLILFVVVFFLKYFWLISNSEYVKLVKTFLSTKSSMGDYHNTVVVWALLAIIIAAIVDAIINERYAFNIISSFGGLLIYIVVIAASVIPLSETPNTRIFWLVNYAALFIGVRVSFGKMVKLCLSNVNGVIMFLKGVNEKKEFIRNKIDYLVAYSLSWITAIMCILVFLSMLLYAFQNRNMFS